MCQFTLKKRQRKWDIIFCFLIISIFLLCFSIKQKQQQRHTSDSDLFVVWWNEVILPYIQSFWSQSWVFGFTGTFLESKLSVWNQRRSFWSLEWAFVAVHIVQSQGQIVRSQGKTVWTQKRMVLFGLRDRAGLGFQSHAVLPSYCHPLSAPAAGIFSLGSVSRWRAYNDAAVASL